MTTHTNRDDLAAYLDFIFGYVDADNTCIALRGVGEKGTAGEGDFREPVIVPMPQSSFDVDRIFGHIQRWSQFGRASFIVPAAIDGAALSDKHATEDRVRLLTTIIVDIDKGNTAEKLAYAQKHLGAASMVVFSGGTTDEGQPKLHAYWRLSEPSDQIHAISAARKMLALKVGGDAAFGRSTQVIRIPGSIYGKGGVAKSCHIANRTNYEYDLGDLLAAIEAMPVMEGLEVDQQKLLPMVSPSMPGGGLNFSGFKGHPDKEAVSFAEDVHEGGDIDKSRWSELGRIAGTHIAWARQGRMSLEEAKGHVWTWAELHQKPPFPAARLESEWKNLVALDVRKHGPMPGQEVVAVDEGGKTIEMVRNGEGKFEQQHELSEFVVSQWAAGEAPTRKFLVDGLILAGKAHMLAAEGGAGKTMMLLDLGLKIATHRPGKLQSWCGLPLTDDAGGTVVMFTTEDDKDELHIRLSDMADQDRIKAAGRRLIIIPTINIGGAFALVERERATGAAMFSKKWTAWLNQLREVADLKAVVIDTLNTTLHGEENNATIINEYIQAAAAVVCGELGAALIITHHVRKPGQNTKIYTAEDMKNSIRGSTALVGAFRVTLGIWHAPDFKERLTRMGKSPHPGQLYNFAVVKANNPEMAFGIRTLLREPNGMLRDITDSEKTLVADTADEQAAWLVHAVAYGAEQGHPFTVNALMKKPPNGRKHLLPAILQAMSERDMKDLCERLLEKEDGRLVQANPKGKGGNYKYLDVPAGPLAKNISPEDGGPYRVAEGGDFKPPSWEHEFRFHPIEMRIVPAGQESARTVKWGARGADAQNRRADENGPRTSASFARFGPNLHLVSID